VDITILGTTTINNNSYWLNNSTGGIYLGGDLTNNSTSASPTGALVFNSYGGPLTVATPKPLNCAVL